MTAMELLPINNGTFSLAAMDAEGVLNSYPGISRVKPATYFGEDIRSTSRRLGLTSAEHQAAWYNRVFLAYSHYWREPMGRIHCWEPTGQSPVKRKQSLINSIALPIVPNSELGGETPKGEHGVLLGFEIPPVELLRRANAIPSVAGTLQVAKEIPAGMEPLFYQIDSHSVTEGERRAHRLDDRADSEGLVWVSANEHKNLVIAADGIVAVAGSRNAAPADVPPRYPSQSWEALSVSIGAAHLGRLAGITGAWSFAPTLRGLVVAGAIQSMMAERFAPLIECLPHDTPITAGLGRLYFRADSSVLSEVLAAARRQHVLPLTSVPQLQETTDQENTVFNLMFELLINARYDDIHRADQQALRKGGILK